MPERMTVELHLAFFWICDACGRDNFARSVSMRPEDMDPRTLAELTERGVYDPAASTEGQFQTRPDRVTCSHCRAEYDTADDAEEPTQ